MAHKALTVTLLLGALVMSCYAEMVMISAMEPATLSNDCAKGPEHWCANIMNAKACHATKHCIQTVWERQSVPEDAGDSVCDICKEMVAEARDQLQSNETQEELKEVFEGSCNLLPVKMIRMKCDQVVDDFIPELIEMLSSQMNPTVVCTTALLCNNAWSDALQAEYKAARTAVGGNKSTGKCGTCQAFMTSNSKRLESKNVDDTQQLLLNLCDNVSSFSDACKALVMDNADEIHSFVSKSLKSEACQPLGFCQEADSKISVLPKSNDRKFRAQFDSAYTDDVECEFCEALIANLRNILVSNTTEDEFVQVLNGLCKQTGDYAKECQALVAQYADVIYSFMMEELNPSQACRLLTLCPAPKALKSSGSPYYVRIEPKDVVKATKIGPAMNHRREMADSNDLLVGQDEVNSLKVKASDFVLPQEILMPELVTPKKPSCILCEYVLHQVVEDLQNTTVKDKIETAIKNVCHKLPKSVGDECQQLINTYGDALIFLLSQELDPSTMCVQLELCTASGTNEARLPAHLFKSEAQDPNTCALCEFVISTLDKKLQDNRTEESIKLAMENVCYYMPSTIQKDCKRLVDAYAQQIIEALLADLTPDEVCIALKFCKPKLLGSESGLTLGQFMDSFKLQMQKEKKQNKKSEPESFEAGSLGEFMSRIKADKEDKVKDWRVTKKGSPTCVMCEYAMSALEKQFITNKTSEEVRRMVDFVCAHLPTTVADMCIDFVEQYGDEIFKLLVSEVAPKAICTQLGLCTPLDDVKETHRLLGHMDEHHVKVDAEADMPSKCEICQTIVEYLDKLLEDDTIEESIDHMIERVCVVIPHGVRDKCTSMVETYGPYLISQLGELMNATKVCQSLHLCKPPPGQVQLLGGKQCTWGPSYWCVSKQHAEACNTLEHCQTNVWMKEEP